MSHLLIFRVCFRGGGKILDENAVRVRCCVVHYEAINQILF